LSGKEFQKDGAAVAKARLARCLCVLGITHIKQQSSVYTLYLHVTHNYC